MGNDADNAATLTRLARAGLAVLKEFLPRVEGFEPIGIEFAKTEFDSDPLPDSTTIVTKAVRIFKTTEERYVLGIVLEPTLEMGEADSQGDVYSAEEVRKAAYGFMENSQEMGIQHNQKAGDKIKVLESWIQREDATIEGQKVTKGTWLLGARITDDDLWEAVKNGDFTGWSIGGVATRTPLGS